MVIALIGLLSALVVGGSVALLRDRPATGEEVLRNAIMRCRRQAVTNMQEVRMSYDAKARIFIFTGQDGPRRVPVDVPGELIIDFLPEVSTSSMLLGGNLVETEKLAYVTFFPDGACSPFRAQLRTGGPSRVLRFDPWTCAEMEGPKS